ncbi:hypothetical protein AB8U03_12780 [Clostridium sp. Mt-5]|uniref:Uncharacterized protein n=1 Tax=Clostridium moutaii TaxID=3240932 RepID=A0ABV4BQI5_9CLOT
MPEAIRQNKINKFSIISLILVASLFLFAGLLHTILGNAFIIIPIGTIIFSIISIVESNKNYSSAGILGIIVGVIYVGIFIYQHL